MEPSVRNHRSAGKRDPALIIAAALTLAIALLHAGMIVAGAPAYDYFRAGPEMVSMALQGSPLPAIVTSGVVLVLLLFAGYALSAAGFIRPLPSVRWALLAISILLLLRGSALLLQIPGYWPESEGRDMVFSAVSLCLGLLYLRGWMVTR